MYNNFLFEFILTGIKGSFAAHMRGRVPFIWTKFGYQKKGFMRVVPLHKDSKNAFGLNLALKPRSHKVRKGLLVDLFSKIERLGKIHQNGHF